MTMCTFRRARGMRINLAFYGCSLKSEKLYEMWRVYGNFRIYLYYLIQFYAKLGCTV
jgi:hypothetical protein